MRPLVEQKIMHAETLALLVGLARGQLDDNAPRLRERVNELAQTAARVDASAQAGVSFMTTRSEFPAEPEQAADTLLALDCLAEPKLGDIGAALADRINWFQDRQPSLPALSSLLRREAARYRVALDSGGDVASFADAGLLLWRAESMPGPSDAATGWVEYEGNLRQIPASDAIPLRFVYPLVGTFEFTFEATARGRVEYGGQAFPRPGYSAPSGRLNRSIAPATFDDGEFHRHRLRVGPTNCAAGSTAGSCMSRTTSGEPIPG